MIGFIWFPYIKGAFFFVQITLLSSNELPQPEPYPPHEIVDTSPVLEERLSNVGLSDTVHSSRQGKNDGTIKRYG